MNKVNFNAFKNIHASEELIQKALALPKTVEKEPVAVLPRYRAGQDQVAAASIMLVFMAGVSAYFFSEIKPACSLCRKEESPRLPAD